MQASSPPWSPPSGVLGRLVAEARERAQLARPAVDSLRDAAADLSSQPPSLGVALRAVADRGVVAVIAEVKRRSPSGGEINAMLSARAQALAYAAGGAAAISVLTEPTHFGGSLTDLQEARTAVAIPLLRKDFVVDSTQLHEARLAGASAILLIARALHPGRLWDLAGEAAELGLEALIEVRTEHELASALATGAPLIGVNQRDLETLEVDATVSERLLPQIPAGRLAVAESGVAGRTDVARASEWGADAVLVGSMLSQAVDPEAAVRGLCGVTRRGRHAG